MMKIEINNVHKILRIPISVLLLLVAVMTCPLLVSCAEDQFEGDKDGYERFGKNDSLPMRMITPEALQGTWVCGNSRIIFSGDHFVSEGSVLGSLQGSFVLTGNAVRVYEKDERIGYFPIVYFKRTMVIRHEGKNHRFVREGEPPYDPSEDIPNPGAGNGSDDEDTPSLITLDISGYYGSWSVSEVLLDGVKVRMDVNWTNSRLVLSETGTFTASYWLGRVEENRDGSIQFTNLSGRWKIDENRNLYLTDQRSGNTYKYQYVDAQINKYLKYRDTNTGKEVYYERIVWMKYRVVKDGHVYVITFYPS